MISIAMATYNGEKYLREQIDSILKQTVQDFELIVCDDFSTDSTWNILLDYQSQDKRIKCYRNEENLGFKKNFEKAIRLCTGDYIALSDQDDIWLPEHLEILLNNIGNANLVCANAMLMTENGESLRKTLKGDKFYFSMNKGNQLLQFLFSNFVQGCSSLFRSSLVPDFVPIPSEQKFHDFWLGAVCLLKRNAPIVYINEIITLYRQHNESVVNSRRALTWRYLLQERITWIEQLRKIACDKSDIDIINQYIWYCHARLEGVRGLKFINFFIKNYKIIYHTKSVVLLLPRLIKQFINK